MKKKLEARNKKLKQEAFDWVVSEIKRYCIRYGWTFNSMYHFGITNKHDKELDMTNNYLAKLVYWYEDEFELFPQIYVKPDGTFGNSF